MRRLLSSWLLFAAVWIPAHALVILLVERRVALTRAAFWGALLVPFVQAIAVESLARPLFDGGGRRAAAAVLRSRRLALVFALGALAIAVEAAAVGGALPSRAAPLAAAALLALAAALVAARAVALGSRRLAALSLLAAAVAAAFAWPNLAAALPSFGGPRALPQFVALVAATIAAAALLLSLSARAPAIAAELFAGAAGAAVGAGLARAVPALLGIPLDSWRALPVTLLATVAAACAAAASLVPDAAESAP